MTRVPVTIKRSSLPFFPRWVAACVPRKRTVLVRHGVTLTARLLAHVTQAERHPWPLAYAMQWIATGFRYASMPFEAEARRAESDPAHLAWARDLLALG
jgi:hypothetical protein